MGILMMIKNDIRKRKSQAAVIFLLSFLITLLISTSVSVLWQSQEQYDEAAARMHLPEVINIFNKGQHSDADEVTKKPSKAAGDRRSYEGKYPSAQRKSDCPFQR